MQRISLPLMVLGVSLLGAGLVACGDDGSADATSGNTETAGDGDGDPTTGDGDGDPTTGDGDGDPTTGDGDGDPTTGDGDGDGDPTTGDGDGDGDPTTGDGDGDPGDCQVWEITYDLTDSEFEIADTQAGAGDQVNVVEEPYDGDETVGPGKFVLQFADVDGAPGGQAFMHAYDMTLDFTVNAPGATVETDLQTDAGPVECGITSGVLDGSSLTWSPSAIVDLHTVGQILCNGLFCGAGGLPNGDPVAQDNTSDMPLSSFEFDGDLSGFTMVKTTIQQDDDSTTSWAYVGTEVSRELVDAPACLCE
jgi:hypothetical protein